MNTWFTADTHFGHVNIIKYTKRPFKDVVEMRETIIGNWNSVVKPNDIVYHIGDFMFGKRNKFFRPISKGVFEDLLKRLNGIKILIKGNHDGIAWDYRNQFYAAHDSYYETEVNGQDITLSHYAMRVWNKSHYGAWNLYGHSHGTLPDDPHARAIDVGVDCHNFTPISFEQVKAIMDKKLWKPIDHHGERKEGGGVGLSRDEYAKLERKKMYEQLRVEFGED